MASATASATLSLQRWKASSSHCSSQGTGAAGQRKLSHETHSSAQDCCRRLKAPARRDVLFFSLLVSLPSPAFATDLVSYEDEKFSLAVPQDWVKGEGNASGVRRVIAFHPASDTSANVNVIITNLGPDFTSMGSFGSVDSFAANMVASMDRSYKRPPGQEARLVDATSRKGLYYVEYTVQVPGEARRHLLTAVGVGETKYYKQLYTVTGQFLEKDSEKYKQTVEQAIQSFRIRPISS